MNSHWSVSNKQPMIWSESAKWFWEIRFVLLVSFASMPWCLFFGDVWPLYDLKEVGWRERFYQDGGTMWSLMCFDLDVKKHKKIETCTSPKFNIDPEKWWLEDKPFLLGFVTFQGRAVKLLGGYVYVLPPNHTTFVALQAGPIVKVYRR